MIKITAAAIVVLSYFTTSATQAGDTTEVKAAKAILMATFDRPESPLIVGPVVISGNHGIADWSQGEMGGRALLRRKEEAWSIALCSGDALRSSEILRKIGLPSANAVELARLANCTKRKSKLIPRVSRNSPVSRAQWRWTRVSWSRMARANDDPARVGVCFVRVHNFKC
jgi:hypothetical protein